MYPSFPRLLRHSVSTASCSMAVCTFHFYTSYTLVFVLTSKQELYVPFKLNLDLSNSFQCLKNWKELLSPLTPCIQFHILAAQLYVPFKLTPCRELLGGFVLYAPFIFAPLTPQDIHYGNQNLLYAPFILHPLTPPCDQRRNHAELYAPFIFKPLTPLHVELPLRCCMHLLFLHLLRQFIHRPHLCPAACIFHPHGGGLILLLVLVKKEERYFPSEIPSSD